MPFLIAVTLAFTGCSKPSSLDIIGEWKINADKSAHEVIKAGKADAGKLEQVKQSIKQRIERFTIVVGEKSLSVKGKELPYHRVSESPGEVVTETEAEGKKVILTFSSFDEQSITIKSSATNDMDYYVWDKTLP
ncbi:MAG: hypothetical protein QM496_13595 [Verrucomicrobiota bacterium]